MISLVWFAAPPEDDGDPLGPWRPGMAFPAPYELDLSRHYEQHVRPIRPPVAVVLPHRADPARGFVFVIDSHPTDDPSGSWTVTCPWPLIPGEQPLITVQTSIACHGLYHGYVRDGVITDDLGSP